MPIHNQLAKLLGRLSQRAHEVVELIWSASGAMNEHLAMSAYREMGVVVDELGERSLYETLFKRLRTHEAAHKGFYAAYAREVAQGMHRWQRRLARAIIVHTYAPVGAGAKVDKPALGRTVRALDPDGGWEEKMADPVQRIAEKLLADGEPLPPFVRATPIAECAASSALARTLRPPSPRGACLADSERAP